MHDRPGQFGTYLKPVLVIMFGILLILLIQSVLNFQTGVQESETRLDFQQQARQDFQRLTDCLRVRSGVSGGRVLLNQTKLARFERDYRFREPPCAEDFRYGYNVTVKQEFLQAEQFSVGGGPVDVVFALDDSGSMGGYISAVKNNVRSFMDDLPQGSRVGLFTYASPPSDYINDHTSLTTDISTVESRLNAIGTDGGEEPEDLAIKHGIEEFDWNPSRRRILIILATESATKDSDTSQSVFEWAEEAASQGIEINTVSGQESGFSEIAETTGGKWFSVSEDFSSILKAIVETANTVGGGSTCTPPPQRRTGGTVEMVFVADASASYQEEWNTLCSKIEDIESDLTDKGVSVRTSIYAPGQPGDNYNGVAKPMTLPGSSTTEYAHTQSPDRVPSCVTAGDNNAVDVSPYGKGITAWSGVGLDQYQPSMDSGYEAWGVYSKWVLEHHDWSGDATRRMLFTFGDHDPTGGTGDGNPPTSDTTWRDDTNPDLLDGEVEIVDNVTALADERDVTVYAVARNGWEYGATDLYDDNTENDAKELMELAATRTGGELLQYSEAETIPSLISGLFEQQQETFSDTCDNQRFQFGERQGSVGDGRSQTLVQQYPVAIYHSEDLKTPGTLRIRLRAGDLERFAGGINQVVATGRRRGENVTATLLLRTSQPLETTRKTVARPALTTYRLTTPSGGGVTVDDGLILGVNGYEQWRRTGGPFTLSGADAEFTGYRGATLQLIAINRKDPTLELDPVTVDCTAPGCSDQQLTSTAITASDGNDDYMVGAFHHNFTVLEHGADRETDEPVACIGTGDGQHCVVLRADTNAVTVRPGSHRLRMTYWAARDEVIVRD